MTKTGIIFSSVAILALAGCGTAVPKESSATNAKPTVVEDVAAASHAKSSPFSFADATDASGVNFVYHNGGEGQQFTILESLGGGVGLFDFDADGMLDVCFAGGGGITSNRTLTGRSVGLFRNTGALRFDDVTTRAMLTNTDLYTHGIASADYNNDGFPDFLVTGYGAVQLWANQGDGTFQEVSARVAVTDDRWSSSAGWGDLNGDGNLDLYIASYVNWSFQNHPICPGGTAERDICPPKEFEPLADYVFFSDGSGSFRDATSIAGLRSDGKGLGVVLADFDADNDLDIYVANDTTDNFLYINDGSGESLLETAIVTGVAVGDRGTPDGSMGVAVGDLNRDGRFDLIVANYEREGIALYRNDGNAQFLHVSQAMGLTALQGLFVSFGAACHDFDHDGDEDMVVANGHVILHPDLAPRRQLPLLLENSNGRFVRDSLPGYFSTPHEGRGLACGDLDGDGDIDLVISHINEPVAVLRNDVRDVDWVGLRLIGRASNRDAIGAIVRAETSVGLLLRQVVGGGSYLSSADKRVFFGLPHGCTLDRMTITWPAGANQEVADWRLNEFVTFIEPE